jgi:hypothetical protein
MRPLEAASTAGLLLYAVHLGLPFAGWAALLLVLVTTIAMLGHLWYERSRWQMVPAYLLGVILPFNEVADWTQGYHPPAFSGWAFFVLACTAIGLCVLMPVFKLPAPTGPYKVGTQTRHLIDETRTDPFSERPRGRRELVVQIWYPADANSRGPFAPYREAAVTSFRSAHFALVKTHSILRADLARSAARYPLLLYCPSWSGTRTESTAQVEELASYGYVVVGIDHPYSSNCVAFPDGEVVRRKFVGEEDYSSNTAFAAFLATAYEQIQLRAADARFVLDTLERLDANDPLGLLTGHLDLEKVGIFGCSLGGGAAVEACAFDGRFKAGADLGGMIMPRSTEGHAFAHLMFLFEGVYQESPFIAGADQAELCAPKRREVELTLTQFAAMKQLLFECGGYWVTIRGMEHIHLFDLPFFTPLRRIRTSPARILGVVRQSTLAFFDRNLKNIGQSDREAGFRNSDLVIFEEWRRARGQYTG